MNQSDIVGPSDMVMPGSQKFLLILALLIAVVAATTISVSLVRRRLRRRRNGERRRPVGLISGVSLFAIALVLALWNKPSSFFTPEFPALPRLFPNQAFFYRPVNDLAISARSDQQVAALGGIPLRPYASSSMHQGSVKGKPFNLVDNGTPRHRFSFTLSKKSQDVAYPITDPAYIQSMPTYGMDDHYTAIDPAGRRMWELWAIRNWFGMWRAGSGALWNLDSLTYPKGSTTASGLPQMPLTFTYAEVAAGRIDHVIFAGSPVSLAGQSQWPARGTDGTSRNPDAPPMGTWLRLKSDVDLSDLGPQARTIAEALQEYGMVIGDTGGAFSLSGTPDGRWNDEDLATLQTLNTDDLEVVDSQGLQVRPDSMESRPVARP